MLINTATADIRLLNAILYKLFSHCYGEERAEIKFIDWLIEPEKFDVEPKIWIQKLLDSTKISFYSKNYFFFK